MKFRLATHTHRVVENEPNAIGDESAVTESEIRNDTAEMAHGARTRVRLGGAVKSHNTAQCERDTITLVY